MNLSGEPVDTPVTYQVVEMEKQKDGQEKEGRKILTGTVEANKSFVPEAIYALPSGNYRLSFRLRIHKAESVRHLRISFCSH